MTKDRGVLDDSHDRAAQAVIGKLKDGCDVAFLTLGDPSVYSTYVYIQKRVAHIGYKTQTVEGVTSFCAAAARLNISLCEGDQALHIIPAVYQEDASHLLLKGTKVLMKSGKGFGRIREQLKQNGLLEKAVMVERCGMEGERIYRDLTQVDEEKSYFSIVIIKDEE
jgi:precorrin-2/cobalt-factor-2 C20-methyltransferase